MPPLGLGANLAMLDGTDLAHALVTESSLDDGVRAYESIMLPRSAEAAKGCAEGLGHLLPRRTPEHAPSRLPPRGQRWLGTTLRATIDVDPLTRGPLAGRRQWCTPT